MRQIIHIPRCLSIALVLVAMVIVTSPGHQAAAMPKEDMALVCDISGGIYYESYIYGEVLEYGCLFLDGSEWYCFGPYDCGTIPAADAGSDDGPLSGSSHGPDGELPDQNGPIDTPPAGPSQSGGDSRPGFETKMGGF
jgi:hypothetical protein